MESVQNAAAVVESEEALRQQISAAAAAGRETCELWYRLASFLQERKRLLEAAPCFERALTGFEAGGKEFEGFLADGLYSYATVLKDLRRFLEAEATLERANVLLARVVGRDHWKTGLGFALLAELRHERGLDAEALAPAEQAHAILCQHLGASHPHAARLAILLGAICGILGKYSESEKHLTEGLATFDGVVGKTDPEVVHRLLRQAASYRSQGAVDRAMDVCESALDRCEASTPLFAVAACNLADLYWDRGRHLEVGKLLQSAVPVLRAQAELHEPSLGRALARLAFVERRVGRYEEGERAAAEAVQVGAVCPAISHQELVNFMALHAWLQSKNGRAADALETLDKALECLERNGEGKSMQMIAVLEEKAHNLRILGEYQTASEMEERADSLRTGSLGLPGDDEKEREQDA
jgi:tetratricopeptide (TPR) repeat protein